MSARSSIDRDDFASLDDEPAMKRKKTTGFGRTVKLVAMLFDSEGLALVRGSLPRSTYVMQRVRVDGIATPMWENYRGRLEAVTLATAVYTFGGAGSDIQSYIEHAACSAIGISNYIRVNSELFQNVPGFQAIFNLYEHTFVPLREYICTPNSCAKKQYPVDFDPDWLCPDAVHPTPQLDSIVRMQEWDSAEEELLLGMLGRLLFPVGRYDNWQACLMLIGVGGSGKTTVTDAIINAGYSPEQIGYMSNTIEKNFPFESLVNSSVVIAADVDKDMMSNLSQTDLHKIINGERVEINIKYGGRRTLQWVAPFMLVANVVPNWQDDQAAELKDLVVQVHILLRCSKAYRRLTVCYTQDGIMPNILAKYYPRRAEVGSKVQQDNDPLVHFVAEVLVHSPGHYVSMGSLREHKIRFCKLHEYDPKLVQFQKEFQNIVSAKDMKVYTSMLEIAQSNRFKNGQSVPKSAFIENCSINAFAIMDDEY
ncbi:hypothetical protein T492DRAFT_1118608 [Pavlovales sp. CCMP2436]|nr:hypothetical protein T492DRAFT_1118608 [Pavlovales sp. CCMP2436]